MKNPRFTLGFMFLLILVCALTASTARYLSQAHSGSGRQVLVILVLVLPMFSMIALQWGDRLLRAWRRRRPR